MKRALIVLCTLLLCAVCGAQQQFVDNYKGQFIGRSFEVEGIPHHHVNALCTDGNYLYAGVHDEIYSIDISDPLHPRVLSKARIYGLVRQMVVQDGTLYASARESGCWIVDVSRPEDIRLITRYETVELSTGIDVAGDVLFLGTRQNGVEFVDVSDPRHPAHIRMEKTGESQSVFYRNGILYSGEWGPHCVTMIDARDMSKLRTLGTVSLQGYGDGVWIDGSRLYVSTGHHLVDPKLSKEECHGNGHGVEIFDLSDPLKPAFLSRVGFDRVFSRYNDYWSPRPCSDGRYVICADTVNGLYVVDASDPEHAELISRVHFQTASGSNIAVNSVAVAKGVVYAATWEDFGLMAFECPDAYPDVREKGEGPRNASYRFPYATAKDSHFKAWKPSVAAPVRGVAVKDDIVFAACSFGGLAVLKIAKNGSLKQIASGKMPFAEDVKVRGDRLYVAEGADGLAVYKIGRKGSLKEIGRYRDFRNDGPMAHCIWVYAPDDRWIVASTRFEGNYYLDAQNLSDIKYVAQLGSGPGWDKFSCNDADSRGMYPSVRHSSGVNWIDLNASPLAIQPDEGFIRPSLYDGVCRYKGDSFITVIKGRIYIYSASEIGKQKTPVDMQDEDFRGFPAWDGGSRLALTCRVRREIRMVDFSDEKAPRLLWMEKTDGYPESAAYCKGKLLVPCGYQGLLIEK